MEEYNDDEGLICQRPSSQTHPDEQHMDLDHFLHRHPLKLGDMEGKGSVMCAGCEKQVLGQSYSCRTCNFYLHESCTNIPPQIYHVMHSCPLNLLVSKYRGCHACGQICSGFFYDCEPCNWRVDYACTLKQLPNSSTNPQAQEQIEVHFHRHPLSIVEKMREDDGVLCQVCEELCFGSVYYECYACNFYVHKSCVEIPRQLYSVYHCCRDLLVFRVRQSYVCLACMEAGGGGCYGCIRCVAVLHLKCALRFAGKIEGLQHICDRTGDLLKKMECLGCKFPLERPWSEHMLEVQSPLHPEHTLILCLSSKLRRCDVCLDDCSGDWIIRCMKCDFDCDSKCMYLMPTIQYAYHDFHLLTFVDKVYDNVKCSACRENCLGKPAFRCLECRFNLHLLCGPLPHTIKYDHVHPLTLEDYFVDGKDEQYCFFCEEKRDPLLPVYNCKRCPYTAEMDCVISGVIACLRGEHEEHTELRCLNRPLIKKNKVIIRGGAMKKLESNEIEENNVINEDSSEEVLQIGPSFCLNDLCDCLNQDEQHKFLDTIKSMIEELYCIKYDSKFEDFGYVSDESCEESRSILGISPYSEKAFTQLIEKFNSRTNLAVRIVLIFPAYEKQLVKCGQYITPRIFVPILKELIDGKHGDLSSGSMLDVKVKSICFMYLSEVIYSMRTTKVIQIKEDKLRIWWSRTKVLQDVGFKVDFIQDHLMLVARAYFGGRARNFANKMSAKQVSKIERLKKKIEVLMARVEELEVEHRDHLEYVESAKTPFMVKCFSDFKAMKWRPAGEGLL